MFFLWTCIPPPYHFCPPPILNVFAGCAGSVSIKIAMAVELFAVLWETKLESNQFPSSSCVITCRRSILCLAVLGADKLCCHGLSYVCQHGSHSFFFFFLYFCYHVQCSDQAWPVACSISLWGTAVLLYRCCFFSDGVWEGDSSLEWHKGHQHMR